MPFAVPVFTYENNNSTADDSEEMYSVNAEGASAVMETILNTPVPQIPVYSTVDIKEASV